MHEDSSRLIEHINMHDLHHSMYGWYCNGVLVHLLKTNSQSLQKPYAYSRYIWAWDYRYSLLLPLFLLTEKHHTKVNFRNSGFSYVLEYI